MAYNKYNFRLGRGAYNAEGIATGIDIHTYTSLAETLATIAGANYFSENFGFDEGFVILNDFILVKGSDGARFYQVTALSPNPTIVVADISGAGTAGPATSTLNAIAVYGDTTGDSLLNSTVLISSGQLQPQNGILLPAAGWSGSALSQYGADTIAGFQMTGPVASPVSVNISARLVDDVVTLLWAPATGTFNGAATFNSVAPLDAKYRPINDIDQGAISVINNGVIAEGSIRIDATGDVTIFNGFMIGNFTAGTIGWRAFAVSYQI